MPDAGLASSRPRKVSTRSSFADREFDFSPFDWLSVFQRLRGDIDPLELDQPFAGVRSERFGRQPLPLRQSMPF